MCWSPTNVGKTVLQQMHFKHLPALVHTQVHGYLFSMDPASNWHCKKCTAVLMLACPIGNITITAIKVHHRTRTEWISLFSAKRRSTLRGCAVTFKALLTN